MECDAPAMPASDGSRRAVVLLSGGLDSYTAAAMAREQGFSAIDQARLATAVSELARDFFRYSATVALVSLRSLTDGEQRGIEIRLQGSGSALDTLLIKQRPELPGGARRVTGGRQHWSRHQWQVLEHTQEGATIVIQQFWRPSK